MDVVIVANFCMDFTETDNGRFSYLANLLCKNNEVEIVTSSFYHITKQQRKKISEHPYKITLISEPGYKKNISIQRFYSHYIWGRNVIKYLKKRKKPDVVYCAVPSLTAPFFVSRYCEINRIRFIVDVQDLWPEAFQMVLNIPVVSKLIFLPFKWMANKIYQKADDIVAVSQTYVDRVLSVNTKCEYGYAIFLGTNLETFDKNSKKEIFLKKKEGEIWLAYCGTLGKSYDLECVIDALDYLKDASIKLIVMGDGPEKRQLEKYAAEKNVNVCFIGRLSYDDMCALLSKCDITANPIVGTSVASIINKHADYVSCGLPVINTQNSVEYQKLIEDYHMGYSVNPGNYQAFADKLQELVCNEKLRKEMGSNARRCAEEKFNRKYTYQELIKVVENKR